MQYNYKIHKMGNFRSSCFQETSCEKPILTCAENISNNDLQYIEDILNVLNMQLKMAVLTAMK